MICTLEKHTLIENGHLRDRSPEKDCCWRMTSKCKHVMRLAVKTCAEMKYENGWVAR